MAGVDDVMVGENRAQADLVLLDADAVAVVPDGLDPVDAASIPLNSLTAAQAVDLLGDPDGRTLLVTGAGGAVGGYAVALARSAGWEVTGLGRPGDEEFVRSTGADFTADAERAAYDAVLDGAVLQQEGLAFVRDGGTFVGVQPSAPVPTERGITVTAVKVVRDASRLAELLAPVGDRGARGPGRRYGAARRRRDRLRQGRLGRPARTLAARAVAARVGVDRGPAVAGVVSPSRRARGPPTSRRTPGPRPPDPPRRSRGAGRCRS